VHDDLVQARAAQRQESVRRALAQEAAQVQRLGICEGNTTEMPTNPIVVRSTGGSSPLSQSQVARSGKKPS
jgi:hypothetical protein